MVELKRPHYPGPAVHCADERIDVDRVFPRGNQGLGASGRLYAMVDLQGINVCGTALNWSF